jgi:hypothetical protein
VVAEETFAALLEAGLRTMTIEGEVVNAGVAGERTDQALKRLDQTVLTRKPHRPGPVRQGASPSDPFQEPRE